MQEFYHEFLVKLHSSRISFARLNKSIHKLWGLVKTMTIEICQSRNNCKYDKKIATATNNDKQNNRTTKNHHTSTLQKHKMNDTLDIFQNQFYINEVFAKIENSLSITPL